MNVTNVNVQGKDAINIVRIKKIVRLHIYIESVSVEMLKVDCGLLMAE